MNQTALGSAAALDVLKFLKLEHDGRSLELDVYLLAARLSRSFFCECFRELAGISPVHLLLNLRMHQADALQALRRALRSMRLCKRYR